MRSTVTPVAYARSPRGRHSTLTLVAAGFGGRIGSISANPGRQRLFRQTRGQIARGRKNNCRHPSPSVRLGLKREYPNFSACDALDECGIARRARLGGKTSQSHGTAIGNQQIESIVGSHDLPELGLGRVNLAGVAALRLGGQGRE